MFKQVSPNSIPTDLESQINMVVESILKKIPHTPPSDPEVMTVSAAAKFLGLSRSTIYTYINKRTIPYVKRNGSVWLLRSKLMEWLQEGEKQTLNQLIR